VREELSIPSSTEFLSELREAVGRCLASSTFEAEANRLVLAVDEAVANVIEHAYAHDLEGERKIEVAIEVDEESFSVEIRDRGSAFDPTSVDLPNIKDHVKQGKRSGLGVFLMRRIMDEVHYETARGVNTLRMMKRATGASPEGEEDA